MKALVLGLLALALPLPLSAGQSLVAGLSQNRVGITANFDGSEILIYGAVKHDAPDQGARPLDVVITVEGPAAPVIVRQKARVAGIWVNRASLRIDNAPSFYAVAASAPLDQILSEADDLRFGITLDRAIGAVGVPTEDGRTSEFVAALERLQTAEDRYRVEKDRVQLIEQTLFRTDVVLPANLTDGDYKVRMFLVRDQQVIDRLERVISVRKEGLERLLYNFAHDQPFLYGLASLVLAAVAGWAASAGFRFLRR